MKKLLLFITVLGCMVAAHATIYTTNWTVNAVIPDNNPTGWANSQTVSTMPGGTLQGVAVNIQLTSGWTGDLYAYLVHDSGFTVLLDRVGTPGLAYGSGAGSMNVTLANGTSWDGNSIIGSIHTAGATPSGTFYNPDASAITSAPGSLGSLLTTPGGTWTLFVADLSGGGLTSVQSWGLQMDIVAVPEVETWIAAALAGAFGAFWLNRQLLAGKKSDSHS